MAQFVCQVWNFSRNISGQIMRNARQYHALSTISANSSYQPTSSGIFNIIKANKITFRPGENKRVKKLGYHAKMKTRTGRLQIMRRILKVHSRTFLCGTINYDYE